MENGNLVQDGQLPQTAGELIAEGQTIRQVQTGYATAIAVQRPRNLKVVMGRCIEEAELSGDLFYYRWTVKSKDRKGREITSIVEGPSINLTLSAIRNFGNVVVIQRPIQETRTSWIFTAAVVDLETGFTLERQFRMDKNFTIYGKMDQHRKDDIRFQIGQSKAIRNAVTNFIPAGITEKMIEAAKKSVRTAIEKKIKETGGKIEAVIEKILKGFEKYGVGAKMLEDKLGIRIKSWDIETLTALAGDLRAIERGDETPETLYGPNEPDDGPDDSTDGVSDFDMKAGDPKTHQSVQGQLIKDF